VNLLEEFEKEKPTKNIKGSCFFYFHIYYVAKLAKSFWMMVILTTRQILKRNPNLQEMGSFVKNRRGNVFFVVNFRHMVKRNVWWMALKI
jgi:hypothetical protein